MSAINRCDSLVRTVSSDPCEVPVENAGDTCAYCRAFAAMCKQNDEYVDSTVECRHCHELADRHQDEHHGLCCDCTDLSWGMPLEQLNAERAAKGKPPVPAWRKT